MDYTSQNPEIKHWLTEDGPAPLEILRNLHRGVKVPKDNVLAEARRKLKTLGTIEVAFIANKHFPFPEGEGEDQMLTRFAAFVKDIFVFSSVHKKAIPHEA